jgi:hypothetical protein
MSHSMRTTKTIATTLIALALAACGGGGHTEEHATTEHTTAEGGERPLSGPSVELHNACVLMMSREQHCTDQFIPALVALRARLDHPHGAAADYAANQEAVVTRALNDYRQDATDEHMAVFCRDYAHHHADRAAALTAPMQACVAHAACQAFVDCDMQIIEGQFRERMEHDAEAAAAAPADAGTAPAPAPSTAPTSH